MSTLHAELSVDLHMYSTLCCTWRLEAAVGRAGTAHGLAALRFAEAPLDDIAACRVFSASADVLSPEQPA